MLKALRALEALKALRALRALKALKALRALKAFKARTARTKSTKIIRSEFSASGLSKNAKFFKIVSAPLRFRAPDHLRSSYRGQTYCGVPENTLLMVRESERAEK